MEWIDPNTGDQFGVNAGLQMQGGVGRSYNIKKPLEVVFKGEYGLSRLEYPLFTDTEVRTFEKVSCAPSGTTPGLGTARPAVGLGRLMRTTCGTCSAGTRCGTWEA